MAHQSGPIDPKTVAVLGGGFLGAHIALRLRQDQHTVTVFTRSEPQPPLDGFLRGCRVVVGDVRDSARLAEVLGSAHHVVYAVGSGHPHASNLDPIGDVLSSLPPLLSVVLQLDPAQTLAFLSSGGSVYGNAASIPTAEDAPPEPLSAYGITKLAAERYLALYQRLGRIQSRVFRIANVYGPGQPSNRGQGVIGEFLRCAASGTRLHIFGDGSVVRDFIHVADVADAIVRLLDLPTAPRVINVGTGVGTTIKAAAAVVRSVTQKTLDLEYIAGRSADVKVSILDIHAISRTIPFNPRSLEDGVRDTWAHESPNTGGEAAGEPDQRTVQSL